MRPAGHAPPSNPSRKRASGANDTEAERIKAVKSIMSVSAGSDHQSAAADATPMTWPIQEISAADCKDRRVEASRPSRIASERSLQMREQKSDIRANDHDALHGEILVKPWARDHYAADGARREHDVETEIERPRQLPLDDQLLDDAAHDQDGEQCEEPAAMAVVVLAQVDVRVAKNIRQHQRCEQIQNDRLHQHRGKFEEGPVGVIAKAEHRPPRLHRNYDDQNRPEHRRPVIAQARARLHEAAKTLEYLRDRKAEDQRNQNRQIAEGIHGRTNRRRYRECMAAPTRFERATFPLGGGRSIQLSYGAGSARF